MLDFNPPELKDKLKSAINEFNFVDGEVEEVEFKTILDEDSYHEYDNTITNSSEVVLFVGDEGASLSVDTFIKMYDEAEFIKINKAQSYACTKDEIFYLLDVSDYDAFMLLEHLKSIENPNVVQDKFANLYWKSEKKINVDCKRTVFPNDKALLKSLYLATLQATKKWTQPLRNWGKVYGEFSIMYEGRFPA